MEENNEIIIYKTSQGPNLEVNFAKRSVWLTQAQLSNLFEVERSVITKHLNNIFRSGELDRKSVCAKIAHTAADGKKYAVQIYNLDAIISVGYRVNSQKATQFRIWATNTLKQYLVKGYAINQKRVKENFSDFENAVNLIKKVTDTKILSHPETRGLLKVITDYANTWLVLQNYDANQLDVKIKNKEKYSLKYAEILGYIIELKNNLVEKRQSSQLFGQERGDALKSIVGNIGQSFAGKKLYSSLEEKSAHLLYFIIKDHPFVDGNKRIASLLFIIFLAKNKYLYNSKGEKKFNDNALVALALLVAESDPKQKETMIKLIVYLIAQ
ncbi:type II toxin-antitoxin system death-on-curing family toxin [Patescibacteria group bacterium]|nr:type II toxin-antitoxin system death-on-curing family toxin [Patescibacteria group bacterium]MBU1613161.1 type II toxin-antitoxin system death-on-curing family toxin [Patescibacteria group bacterium]